MKNMENDVEINRYEFIIDIAISDGFNFEMNIPFIKFFYCGRCFIWIDLNNENNDLE